MMNHSLKRTAVAGAAALALVGASLGAVAAQQAPSASPAPNAPSTAAPGTRQQPPAGVPGQTRPTPEQRQQQHQQFLASVASKLGVSAERLQQAMDQTRQELGIPERGPGGPGGPGGHRSGPGGGHRGGPGGGLDAAAGAVG